MLNTPILEKAEVGLDSCNVYDPFDLFQLESKILYLLDVE